MTKSLMCRFGKHHWQVERTADNEKFRRCARCGKDDAGTGAIVGADPSAFPR